MATKKKEDYSTKREVDPDYEAVKVTWWNGRRWYITYEVRKKQVPCPPAGGKA